MNFIDRLNSGFLSFIGLCFGWFIIFFSCGCMLDSDADFDFPSSPKSMVVESYLCPGKNYEVLLMESNDLSDDLSLLLSWRAKVSICQGKRVIPLSNILNVNKETGYAFNYGTRDRVPDDFQNSFELEIITLSGLSIKAKTSVVGPVEICKYRVDDNTIEVSFENDSNVDQRYYCVVAEGIFEEEPIKETEYLDCTQMSNGNICAIIKGEFYLWESIKIKLFHITKENYEFQKSVKEACSANSHTFCVPSKIKSNIEGAMGIFTYYTVDSVRVR